MTGMTEQQLRIMKRDRLLNVKWAIERTLKEYGDFPDLDIFIAITAEERDIAGWKQRLKEINLELLIS